jgi:hypothetical protein
MRAGSRSSFRRVREKESGIEMPHSKADAAEGVGRLPGRLGWFPRLQPTQRSGRKESGVKPPHSKEFK